VANIKSQIKRNRQNDKKRLRNRVYRGEARIAVKNARTTFEEGAPESKTALLQAISALDKAVEQGVIHKNNAARRKSRLVKAFAKMMPVQVETQAVAVEPVLEAEPTKTSSPRGKKATPRTSSPKGKKATRKVEVPEVETAAEPTAETKTSSHKGKTTAKSSPKAKKPVGKKTPAASSQKEKKTASRTSSPKGKKPAEDN
jgi:small subunit ribosomal protein S20